MKFLTWKTAQGQVQLVTKKSVTKLGRPFSHFQMNYFLTNKRKKDRLQTQTGFHVRKNKLTKTIKLINFLELFFFTIK